MRPFGLHRGKSNKEDEGMRALNSGKATRAGRDIGYCHLVSKAAQPGSDPVRRLRRLCCFPHKIRGASGRLEPGAVAILPIRC